MNAFESSGKARKIAADILAKIDVNKAYADVLLEQTRTKRTASAKDQPLVTEIVYGTLRWRGRIDSYLRRLMRRSLEQTDPFVRNLLRLTVYQVVYLDRIPDYAAVNEAVNLAKAHGGTRVGAFVNGVLRNFLRMEKDFTPPASRKSTVAEMAEYWSHPDWLIKVWMEYLDTDEITALLEANNRQAPLTLRVNIFRSDRDALLNLFASQGIAAAPTCWSPQGIVVRSQLPVEQLPGFKEGLFQVQGEASQLVAFLLNPQAGESVLDACAAPGGKATHIAELMEDRGQITAVDISLKGISKIRENAGRLGLHSIRAVQGDTTKQLASVHEQTYDRILVDAPCSGLGTLRSHPEIKWNRGTADIIRLHDLQKKILTRTANRLKPDGVLVYSTCTLSAAENENIVCDFLAQHEEFVLADAASYLPDSAKQLVRNKFFLALPHRHNTDGFFAAHMRKVK